jgi:dienelactone hydrolase
MCIFGEPLKHLHVKRKDTSDDFPLRNWIGRLCKMQNHNYLFLYSDADDLIPADQVEEVAEIAASHGNKVEKIFFKGSEHVQHYRKYPEVGSVE